MRINTPFYDYLRFTTKEISYVRFNSFVVLFVLGLSSLAQVYLPNQHPDFYFNQAISHYQSENFKVAKHLLDEYLVSTNSPQAIYYRAMSAVKSDQKSGEYYVNSFLNEYPLHPLAHKAQFELATHYFKKRIYQKALLTYGVIDMKSLETNQQEQAYFEKGYSLLQLKITQQGVESLNKANSFKGEYKYVSAYYLGVMSDGFEAEEWFLEASESDEWKIKSAVYLSQIYLSSGEFEKLINQNRPLLSSVRTTENHELHFYSGEANYRLGKYRQAVRVYQDGLTLNIKKPTAETLFKLGHAYYETGEKDKAIEQLKKSGLNESPTGQASAFQLGKIYTEQGKYTFALHAFEISGASNYDLTMKEESRFLASKINIQLEQFGEAIEQLENFISEYSTSTRLNEANELLSIAYLNTSNYDLVINHFEKSNSSSSVLRRNYQKVTLLKAKQAFSDRRVSEAVIYFNKSVNVPMDRNLEFDARYWLGECYFILGDVVNSKASYAKAKIIKTSSPLPDYGLGYLTYNEKKYEEAIFFFQSFRRKAGGQHSFSSDALLRIADCDYALKKYDQALSGYNSLEGTRVAQDYLFFQTGLIHQLNGRTAQAVASFEKVVSIHESNYRDNAIFQLGLSYFENADFEKAAKVFTNYLDQYPDVDFAPFAYIKRALCYFNQEDNKKATDDYVFVLDNYISHSTAQNALLGIQELQKRGEIIPFDNYLTLFREAHPDDSSLESIEFEQAKNTYFAQNYPSAIAQFEALLSKNPDGDFKEDMIYYLGDASQRNGNLVKANEYYEQIISMIPSRYLNRSLDKRGRLLIETKQGVEAIKNYELLKEHSKNRKEVYLANEGLMKAYYQIEQWDQSITSARSIVEAEWRPSNAENQATLFIGKGLQNKENYAEALDEFLKVINSGTDKLAAEAKFRIAEIQFDQDQNQQSLKTLFQLNSAYGTYQKWLGKSFLLIADNYLKMEELLQAKATLNSLIENFPDPEIKSQAGAKLDVIDKLQEVEIVKDTVE